MKKKICVLLAGICLVISPLQVQADLIWEPRQDPFYAEYADQCVYENSTYIANGSQGTVTVYESPDDLKEVDVWENGKSAYISFLYTDEEGERWGIYDNGDVNQSGWIRIEDMVKRYNAGSFAEEFQDRIVEEEGELDNTGLSEAYFWTYPGSKDNNSMNIAGFNAPQYHSVFVDEAGHRWGNIGYYYGRKNVWICLDAPAATFEELYPEGAPKRGALLEGTEEVIVGTENVKLILPGEQTSSTETAQSTQESQQESSQVQADTKEEADSTVAASATDSQEGESAIASAEEPESQVSFVAAIIAAVVAVTGGLLAALKKSFRQKNNEN